MPAPLFRFALADGKSASLLVGDASTVLSVDDSLVSSWDLAGRPYALVRESGTYRRGLDGGLLLKREATAEGLRIRRRLAAAEGASVVEAARLEAAAALQRLSTEAEPVGGVAPTRDGADVAHAIERLRAVVAMDAHALAADAARFLQACGPVGILPPDQYLSLVLRITEGCSWNACTFCSLYRGVPFRFRPKRELVRHVAAVRDYFGRSIALRRSVFLGDANALCLPKERLLPLLETVAEGFPGAPLFSFVDAWTGQRKSPAAWQACAELGLKRVYVGLETGDPGLLAWLEKPGSPEDAVALVSALHEAGIGAGVVVLTGAGGARFDAAHVAQTSAVLRSMALGSADIVYFSEYVDDPSLAYGRRAAGAADLVPLPPERAAAQRAAITSTLTPARQGGPRVAIYDIREFVY